MNKILFTILTLLFFLNTKATDYYISLAGSSGNSGLDDTHTWSYSKFQSYINSTSPSAGDRFLLKRGETFYGGITIGDNGGSGNQIVIGAYGTGDKPIISGLTTVSGWVSLGSNKWEATVTGGLSTILQVVTVNGIVKGVGRYPNPDAASEGWLSIDSHVGTTQLSDGALAGIWTGGEVVVRSERWVIDRSIITNQVGSTLTYNAITYAPNNGWGYFIQNHSGTLDQAGEWYYNKSTKKLRIYSTTNPGSTVKASTVTNLIDINSHTNIKIENVHICGANQYGVYIPGSAATGITIQNCKISNIGTTGIISTNTAATGITITGDSIITCLNKGIETNHQNNTITSNYIYNIGMIKGMGESGDGSQYSGIVVRHAENNHLVQYNIVRRVGGSGITIKNDANEPTANNWSILNNRIDSTNIYIDDHGALYTWAGTTDPPHYISRTFDGNIITNTFGNKNGTSTQIGSGFGIYLDIGSSDIRISNNYVDSSGRANLFLNFGAERDTVINNTFAFAGWNMGTDPRGCQMYFNESDTRRIKNNVIKHNFLWARGSQNLVRSDNDGGSITFNPGKVDSNYYVHLKSSPFTTKNALGTITRTFAEWKSLGFDAKGDTSVLTSTTIIKDHYAFNSVNVIPLLGYSWLDAKKATYSNTYTVPVYRSFVARRHLITGIIPPQVTVASSQRTYTSPGNITLTANATDQDGTISSVSFYNGSTLLGTDNTNPYSFNWTGVPVGTYTITAKATDNDGLTTTSQPITIDVVNTKPTVSITSPASGATYVTGATVNITATAADANGSVARVNFYINDVFLSTDASSPYTASWVSTAGGFALTAVAVDNLGDSTTSATKNIYVGTTNQAPSVSVTSDSTIYTAPATFTLVATAFDEDGSIVRVNFYRNSTFIATDVTAPYTSTRNATSGTYVYHVVAIDDDGDSTISATYTVTVIDPPNIKPTVTILQPTVDSGYTEPADVEILVGASDADGTISAVHFFSNGVLVGSDASSPYTLTLSGLDAGGYSLEAHAIDNDGDSTISEAVNIVVAVPVPEDPDDLSVSVTITSPILCAGGTATVEVSATGGSGTYVSGIGEFSKVAGVYDFVVEDDAGTKDTVTLAVNEPGELSATATLGTITQRGGTANVTIVVIGGTAPYQYSKNGGSTWQTSSVFTLKAGSYIITVRDKNGCSGQVSFDLKQPKRGGNYLISNTIYIPL